LNPSTASFSRLQLPRRSARHRTSLDAAAIFPASALFGIPRFRPFQHSLTPSCSRDESDHSCSPPSPTAHLDNPIHSLTDLVTYCPITTRACPIPGPSDSMAADHPKTGIYSATYSGVGFLCAPVALVANDAYCF
jgi:hypothetical protein